MRLATRSSSGPGTGRRRLPWVRGRLSARARMRLGPGEPAVAHECQGGEEPPLQSVEEVWPLAQVRVLRRGQTVARGRVLLGERDPAGEDVVRQGRSDVSAVDLPYGAVVRCGGPVVDVAVDAEPAGDLDRLCRHRRRI